VWLDVDTTIRKMSGGKKSLDDFLAKFEGLGGNTPAKVVPYTFADIVTGLNAVVPNDWAGFLRQRLDTNQAHAPLGGIENVVTNWRTSRGRTMERDGEYAEWDGGFLFSLGLQVNPAGALSDVLKVARRTRPDWRRA